MELKWKPAAQSHVKIERTPGFNITFFGGKKMFKNRKRNPAHQMQWWSRRWTQRSQVRQCPARGGRIILHRAHLFHFVFRDFLADDAAQEAADWMLPLLPSLLECVWWREATVETNPGPRLVTIRRTMVRSIPEVTVHTWRRLTSPRGRISVIKR